MNEFGVKRLVFSSSSTVFGNPNYLPIDESHPTGQCTNPYGRTKYFCEEIIKDLCSADKVRSGVDFVELLEAVFFNIGFTYTHDPTTGLRSTFCILN